LPTLIRKVAEIVNVCAKNCHTFCIQYKSCDMIIILSDQTQARYNKTTRLFYRIGKSSQYLSALKVNKGVASSCSVCLEKKVETNL
jgi:hypothetical protein